ncbi:hypothetical protein MJI37_34760, partial [Salmonella enterica subsp. enterica serovar Cerro]|nr:hypothetical protein [Salmonella enterica subsp. enterica serovar Cerro]
LTTDVAGAIRCGMQACWIKPENADLMRTQDSRLLPHIEISRLWRPDYCAVIAGALRYPRYRWYDRLMIKLIMKMSGGETDTSKE